MFHTYISYVHKYGAQSFVSLNTAAATECLRRSRLPMRHTCRTRDVIKGTMYIYYIYKHPCTSGVNSILIEFNPAAFIMNQQQFVFTVKDNNKILVFDGKYKLLFICYKWSGMNSIKIATDSQAYVINKYNNLKQRLLKCSSYNILLTLVVNTSYQ